jgi:hypothetical protein
MSNQKNCVNLYQNYFQNPLFSEILYIRNEWSKLHLEDGTSGFLLVCVSAVLHIESPHGTRVAMDHLSLQLQI